MNDFQKDMDKYKDKLSKLIQSENNKSKYNPELRLLNDILNSLNREHDERIKSDKITLFLTIVSIIVAVFALF